MVVVEPINNIYSPYQNTSTYIIKCVKTLIKQLEIRHFINNVFNRNDIFSNYILPYEFSVEITKLW